MLKKAEIENLREKYHLGFAITEEIKKKIPNEKDRRLFRLGAIYALGQVLEIKEELQLILPKINGNIDTETLAEMILMRILAKSGIRIPNKEENTLEEYVKGILDDIVKAK